VRKAITTRINNVCCSGIILGLSLGYINGWEIPTWYLWVLIGLAGIGIVLGLVVLLMVSILSIFDPSFTWDR